MKLYDWHKCIPFYKDKDMQYFSQTDDDTFATWLCPKNRLIPFQVTRSRRPISPRSGLFSFKLIDYRTEEETNLLSILDDDQLKIYGANQKDIIQHFATQEVELECGLYYYEIYDGFEKFYSEVFRVMDFEIEFETKAIIDGKNLDIEDKPTELDNSYVGGINYMG